MLLTSYECLTREQTIKTVYELRQKLLSIFRDHIGYDDGIFPVELFEEVFDINPQKINIYKREYWWNFLKRVMQGLRSDGTLFIINDRVRLYILKTEEEGKKYKKRLGNTIKELRKSQGKADDWIRRKKWRYF